MIKFFFSLTLCLCACSGHKTQALSAIPAVPNTAQDSIAINILTTSLEQQSVAKATPTEWNTWSGQALAQKNGKYILQLPLLAYVPTDSAYWFFCLQNTDGKCTEEWWFRTIDGSVWTRQDGTSRRVPTYRLSQPSLGTPISPWHFWPTWSAWAHATPVASPKDILCSQMQISDLRLPYRTLTLCKDSTQIEQLEWRSGASKIQGQIQHQSNMLEWKFSTGGNSPVSWQFSVKTDKNSLIPAPIPPWDFSIVPGT